MNFAILIIKKQLYGVWRENGNGREKGKRVRRENKNERQSEREGGRKGGKGRRKRREGGRLIEHEGRKVKGKN